MIHTFGSILQKELLDMMDIVPKFAT